ncbi:MAG: hypothetical protein U9R58_05645 [Chloroflexota bacterium]|nr:hypothetical protein [Chloroflexota bacterium]
MPLVRNAIYARDTQIYVAPTWDRGDLWIATLRHIAKEGGMFVIGCCCCQSGVLFSTSRSAGR